MTPRVHIFEKVENFRDFGGYASRFGGRIVTARLYRSGHYGRATSNDLDGLEKLGLTLVADLRRPAERALDRVRSIPRFMGEIVSNDIDDLAEAPHITFLRETDMSAASVSGYLLDYYSQAPFEPRHVDLFGRFLRGLATLEGSALVHCAAGKDRTGILVALLHNMLGVSEPDMMEDFLLTNEVLRVDSRLEELGGKIYKLAGRMPSELAIRCFWGVDGRHLLATFDAIRTKCGSTEDYVTQVLGIEPEVQALLADRLLKGHP